MRDVKFRAYNKEKDYFELFHLCKHAPLATVKIPAEGSWDILAEWEQFTGLRDCNGVDIYEGDFVRDHVGVGVVRYSDRNGAFRVSYGDGLAKWFYDYILYDERESIQVIGNIHQNPELLK